MSRSALTGFLIGPPLLVAMLLLRIKAGLALVIAIGALFGAVLAGAATGSRVQARRPRPRQCHRAGRIMRY